MKKIYTLHYFRAFAAILVVLFHITSTVQTTYHGIFLWNIFRVGTIGIDFFFILSGFLLTYVHQHDRGDIKKLFPFLKKRFFRIFPSYWITFFIILGITLVWNTHEQGFILSPISLVTNLTLFPSETRLIPQSWTLSIEIYFYLFFGFLLLVRSLKIFLSLFFVYLVGIFAVSHFLFSQTQDYLLFVFRHSYLEFILSPYLAEFFLGCVACSLFLHKRLRVFFSKKIFLLLSVTTILFSFFVIGSSTHIAEFHRVVFVGIPLAFTILIVSCFEQRKQMNKNRIGLILGDASYSIYLLHFFIITTTITLVGKLFVYSNEIYFLYLLLFAVSLGIPTLFWIFIDKPMQQFLKRL